MIQPIWGWLKRHRGRLLLGALLLLLALIGTMVHVLGPLRPLRYDMGVNLEDLAPGEYGPRKTCLSKDGSLLWLIYMARNQETRMLRCDLRTRQVVREERSLAAIEPEVGDDFLDAYGAGMRRGMVVATVSGLPYACLEISPNYFSPDPVNLALERTLNGRIRWNLALKGGDVPIAAQFAWGVAAGSVKQLMSPAIAVNGDGSLISIWDSRSGRLFLVFNDQDYRK